MLNGVCETGYLILEIAGQNFIQFVAALLDRRGLHDVQGNRHWLPVNLDGHGLCASLTSWTPAQVHSIQLAWPEGEARGIHAINTDNCSAAFTGIFRHLCNFITRLTGSITISRTSPGRRGRSRPRQPACTASSPQSSCPDTRLLKECRLQRLSGFGRDHTQLREGNRCDHSLTRSR